VVPQANICQCEEPCRADDGWNRSLIAQMDFRTDRIFHNFL